MAKLYCFIRQKTPNKENGAAYIPLRVSVSSWLAAHSSPYYYAPGWAVTWHEFTLAPAHITCLPVRHIRGSWWRLFTAIHTQVPRETPFFPSSNLDETPIFMSLWAPHACTTLWIVTQTNKQTNKQQQQQQQQNTLDFRKTREPDAGMKSCLLRNSEKAPSWHLFTVNVPKASSPSPRIVEALQTKCPSILLPVHLDPFSILLLSLVFSLCSLAVNWLLALALDLWLTLFNPVFKKAESSWITDLL